MIEKRDIEWQNLRAKAAQMLETPRLLPKDLQVKHFDQTLHLWISPTFTPEKHWIFYTPQPQLNPLPKPVVQQIIWRRDTDFQRMMNAETDLQDAFQIEPTFEIKTVELERKFYREIRTELSKIQIPPFIEEEMDGRDGEIFGVETLDLFYGGRIIWWSECPHSWKELADWSENVREFLEKSFNEC